MFVPLFTAKVTQGVTIYQSRRSGFIYTLQPMLEGFSLSSKDAGLEAFCPSRKDTMFIIEMVDLASLAKFINVEGSCSC